MTPDCYPIPYIQDFSAQLAGCSVFSTIDLIEDYHQIKVLDDFLPKTAVITLFRLYESLRELKHEAQSFQRLMDTVCTGLDFVLAHLDYFLIAKQDVEIHKRHQVTLFDGLEEYGLVINAKSIFFGVTEINFLGQRITYADATPLPEKVKAIIISTPYHKQTSHQFVGMVSFYHGFVPSEARVMRSLYKALSKDGSKR